MVGIERLAPPGWFNCVELLTTPRLVAVEGEDDVGHLIPPKPPRLRLLDESQAAALGFITEEEFAAWLAAGDLRTLWEWAIEERQYRGRRLEPAPDPGCFWHQERHYRPDPTYLPPPGPTVYQRYDAATGQLVVLDGPPACTCPQPVPA